MSRSRRPRTQIDAWPGFVDVLSTLLITVLFNPLRSRLQRLIDRRFYRRKYDATRVLAGFAQRARDEVDLEALSNELVETVHYTVQPQQISLWLRDNKQP